MAHATNIQVVSNVYRPLFLDSQTGAPTGIPSNAILTIAGVEGPSFTVGGRHLLFADGSSTSGGLSSLNLQTAYQNSSTAGNPALIDLIAGRDLIIDAPTGPGISFKIDSTTGAVTIGGDLIIGGTSTIVNSTTYKSDNLRLTAQSPSIPALWIGPDTNQNSPTASPFVVSLIPGSTTEAALKVDASGITSISTLAVLSDMTVVGKINGVDVATLASTVQSHIFVNGTLKHLAREINIDAGTFISLPLRNVQTVLEFLDNSINNIDAQVLGLHGDVDNLQTQINNLPQTVSTGPTGFTFIAESPLSEWVIEHNKNSKNLMFLVFDADGFMFQPDSAQIVNESTVIIKFGSPQTGRVNIIFYTTNLF